MNSAKMTHEPLPRVISLRESSVGASKAGAEAELGPSLGAFGSLEVRLATTKKEIRKAQRLRYNVFYEEGGAKADRTAALLRRDVCAFDASCDHLLVIDHAATNGFGKPKPKVVGTYRLLRQERAEARYGFYSAQEYDIAPLLARHRGKRFLELGRSCVLAPYRSKRTLELLWRGIWAYARHYRIDALFGCASLAGTNPLAHAASLSFLSHFAGASDEWSVRALDGRGVPMQMINRDRIDKRRALAALPPLIKGYLRCGAKVGDGAVIDRQFGTTDVFIIMPVAELDFRYIEHFGGPAADKEVA
ncbi:MAG: L-ornithine Nalpha-acyltransferase [Methylobacteriaceae bacterium]|nr:L-ornithine Nalpha-acyltransferase [Methylobacteriaceae bacterium]